MPRVKGPLFKMLLCDNDEVFLAQMGAYLMAYGFHVDAMQHTENLISSLEKGDYSLVALNLWSKPINGLDLCGRIRKSENPDVAKISIVMTAPEDLDHDTYKFLRQHDASFIEKFQGPDRWYERISSISQR